MGSDGRGEPRCSYEIADKIVTLLKNDEEARCRWNTLLGRGIGASMRDTFLSYSRGRRGEYVHGGAAKRASTSRIDASEINNSKFFASLSRARVIS